MSIAWLRAARQWSLGIYDFDGLRAFKAKLRPQGWVPIYLSYPTGQGALRSIYDVLAAFARGGLLRFGLRTVLRAPSIIVRLLALLLIPWTLLLALSDATHWFPSACPTGWSRCRGPGSLAALFYRVCTCARLSSCGPAPLVDEMGLCLLSTLLQEQPDALRSQVGERYRQLPVGRVGKRGQ